jgi:enoyl-CoA hydratase
MSPKQASAKGLISGLREDGAVALIVLDVPGKRNAISVELANALESELNRCVADESIRAIVITGTDPAFCAGIDLDDVSSGREIPLGFIERIASLDTPVIAALNGPAATGGLELALACHLRIGSERTQLLDRHAQLGLFPRAGLSARLVRLIGPSAALEISLSGRRVNAEEAHRLGLIDRIVAHHDLIPQALSLATGIATVEPELRRRLMSLYRVAGEGPLSEALSRELAANRAWHEIAHTLNEASGRFAQIRATGASGAAQTPAPSEAVRDSG